MELIQQRLREYKPVSKEEELNAYKEICQEIALAALARAGFFQSAQFQGGTCLRIIHRLDRFSEDLDFVLTEPNPKFSWVSHLHTMENEFLAHGIELTAEDRSKASTVIKKAFLKESSFGQVLTLQHLRALSDPQTIRIKLEIDTNPPSHSVSAVHVIDYPFPVSITSQDLPSLFAGKCLALLCREFMKGRDWYDFLWYLQMRTPINYEYLHAGMEQYEHQSKKVDREWLIAALGEKIANTNWNQAKMDVRRFLRPDRQHVIREWSQDLFMALLLTLPS